MKNKLTVKDLKKIIENLPDDMEVIFPETSNNHVVEGFWLVNEVTELSESGENNALCLSSNNIITTTNGDIGINGRTIDTKIEKVLF